MKPLSLVSDATSDQINLVLGANLKNVIRWSTPVLVASSGLGAAVTIQHDLKAIPNRFRVESYVDSRWWADQDDRKTWTATTITFHTSHAGVFIVEAGVQ